MQEMESEFVEETTTRQSSVVSSEASSKLSVSSGYDCETQLCVLKKKSSSMSCLPDHISDFFDHNTSTLPPNLSAVKPFEENLQPKGALSAESWYKTAECLEGRNSEEELSSNDDQRSAFDRNPEEDGRQAPNGIDNGRDSKEKKDVDLSEINTVTHTFVRSSALDILAQFPKTETVSTMEESNKQGMLNVIEEDSQFERKSDCVDNKPKSSQSVDHLSGQCQLDQNEVISWSSTSDIKKKHKRKGLFQHNKKVKDVSNLSESKSTEQLGNQEKTKKKKKVRKEKAKSVQSMGWSPMNIFRGKYTVTEEKPSDTMSKKHKPVQKSQSFDPNSLPRSSQLNRMDSFRKLFKRPRDSGASAETQPIDNVRCVEISSPILKSDFTSKNLVDREVFLRERAYQLDKTKVNRVESVSNVNEDDDTSVNNDNNGTDERETESVFCNGDVEPEHGPQSQESPIPPLRHKHLQKKQRLSMQGVEGLLQDDVCQDNENNNENYEHKIDKDTLHAVSNTEKDEEVNDQNNKTDYIETCFEYFDESDDQEQLEDNTCSAKEVNCNIERNSVQNERHCEVVNHHQATGMEVGDEQQTIDVDNIVNNNYVVVESVPGDSDTTVPSNATLTGEHVCAPLSPEGANTIPDVSPATCKNSAPQSPESEFEEVFVECINDENISLDSATVLVDKPQVGSDTTDGISMPTGRWNSDVTSRASQRAISKAIQKKPASFSGVRTSPEESTKGPNMATSSIIGGRQSVVQTRRSSSTFRLPSVRFEPTEPISLITDMVPVTFPNFLTDRRSQIVLELFTTERTYVRGLETMIELFQKPMLAAKMDERDVAAIFSNLNDIFAVNKDLLFLLWEKVKHWNNEQCIAQMFIDMEERFKIYATYCKNFDKADSMLKQKIKKNKEFERFLKGAYMDPLCQPGLDLPAYLITIVQRIPRYLLLLKDLFKKTPSSHPDYSTIQTALTRMNKVAEYINSQLQEVHGKKAMQELRSTVIGLKAYEVKGRTLLKEAEVCLMNPKKPYKCLLFNDIMVFAVQGSKDRSEIEMTLELKTLWFEDLKKQDPQTSKCDAIELYTPHRPYTMYACSRTDKRIWIQKLRTAIVTLLYGPDCEDPDGMDTSRRKASDTYFDGSVYCGEYLNGKRHGQGVMAWPNRTRYEGSWADDERHGHGQLTYYTGEKYVGNWVADKKDGQGRQTYVNNDVYNGSWKEGKMHGKGVIDYANGDRYVGEMSNNEVEGDGEITCASGLIYKGEWKKSKRHGQGHMFLPNGNEYKGEMLNDRICGHGHMIYFNGDDYTGEWVNEERHGSGNFKLVNGTVYDGQWTNDLMYGQGKMTYPNGDEYTGTWHRNQRVGKGQLMYAHGDTYNGQWYADTMHGRGIMYYKDGSVYDGDWEHGKASGHGKTVFKDKSIYEGEYYLGFRHGRGQLIYPNNVLYVGEWKWDKFDGNGVFNDPNTDYSYTGDWSCGMREGSGIEISYRTRYEGSWKADMKHGTGEEKSHAGHVFKGTWKENRKHGEGIRKLRSNVEETQHWFEGHLMDGGETVAEGLPPLPRR